MGILIIYVCGVIDRHMASQVFRILYSCTSDQHVQFVMITSLAKPHITKGFALYCFHYIVVDAYNSLGTTTFPYN